MHSYKTPNTYTDPASQEIIRQQAQKGRNLGALTISSAAEEQGAKLKWITKRDVWAVFEDRRVAISGHRGTESALAAGIVGDKHLTKEFLLAAGINAPVGRQVNSPEDAIAAQREIGRPVVVKPKNGAMGRGVTVNVTEPEDLRAAYRRAARSGGVLVEQFIQGSSEYRAHASSTECFGVFRRLLPSVTGDGESTVLELIENKNELRKNNPSTDLAPIIIDDVAESFLKRRGLSWDSVIPAGEDIAVRDVNGITSGGDSEQCLDSVSELLKKTAIGAVASIPGMDWGGVDILVEDATEMPYVMEINTDAAINGSTFPVFGTPRDLGSNLWDRLYARSAPEQRHTPTPANASPLSTPLATEAGETASETTTLQTLLMHKLSADGLHVTRHNKGIWSATREGQSPLWFSSVASRNFPTIAAIPIRRPAIRRTIMQEMHLPQPQGRMINTFAQLDTIRREVNAPLHLLPARGAIARRAPRVVPRNGNIDPAVLRGRRPWIAQTMLSGHRFKVVSTVHGSLAVFAPHNQPQADTHTINRISELATLAVRAIPQLPWAVVDIASTPPDKDQLDLVEDISLNPLINTNSTVVVAGTVDDVLNMLIEEAQPK